MQKYETKKENKVIDKKAIERGNEIIMNKKPLLLELQIILKLKQPKQKQIKMVIPREKTLDIKNDRFAK